MGAKTTIPWTEATWTCIRGCSRISPGCGGPNSNGGCYAEAIAARFSGPGLPYHGLARMTPSGPRWTGIVRFVEEHLEDPIRWKRPRMIFVNSMSDTFHERVHDVWIDRIMDVMLRAPWHTYQMLTKRVDRMLDYLTRWVRTHGAVPPHIWAGCSIEDQERLEQRLEPLKAVPASVRWISYEPALGPINGDFSGISWLVLGGESAQGGQEPRPVDLDWFRSVIAQCRRDGTAPFVKQLGTRWAAEHGFRGKAEEPEAWPEELRVREFPAPPSSSRIAE